MKHLLKNIPQMQGEGAGSFDMEKVKSMIMSGTGFSSERVQKLINEFPIDKYRDENGVIRCPMSREQKDKLKSRLKNLHKK